MKTLCTFLDRSISHLRMAVRVGTALATTLWATQCAMGPMESASATGDAAGGRSRAVPAGLGTGFGEARASAVNRTDFVRAKARPDGLAKVFYNDRQGVLAATGGGGKKFSGWHLVAGGLVSFGLQGEGGWLRGVEQGGLVYVVGEPGDRYDILVRNETSRPLEVVVSVDGLDVMDGRAASVAKRGYVIPGGGSVRVEGWRLSLRQVAAFRFARVPQSYVAQKHGSTRNVGVIGLAVFEAESRSGGFAEPPRGWRGGDLGRWHRADPFPAGRSGVAP